ncbi:MAG: molybdopterin cofactor-binding domain-containing protein [Bradyrhizobium sp.]
MKKRLPLNGSRPTQGTEFMLRVLADQIFHIPDEQIHIRTYDVGGAFGVKEQPYPEDIAILHAARVFGRPREVARNAGREPSFR